MRTAPATLSSAVAAAQPGLRLTPFLKSLVCTKTELYSQQEPGDSERVHLGHRLVLPEVLFCSTMVFGRSNGDLALQK